MKAIIHIGAPKTGTTSIQDFLFANTAALAKQGFRFHRNVAGRGSQFEYPMAAMAQGGKLLHNPSERIRYKARTLDEAQAESAPHVAALADFPTRWREPVALFSSEHILPWLDRASLIKTLDQMFTPVFSEVRYVVYFRAQRDLILSQYSEQIKRGATLTLDAFLDARLARLDLHPQIKRWVNTVGKDRLDVRLYDPSFLLGRDLIGDFCAACGIDPAGLKTPAPANESLVAPAAECLRVLNSMVPEIHPEGGVNPLRREVLDALITLSRDMPRLALTPEQEDRIEKAVAAGNQKLKWWFFPDRTTLFSAPASRSDPLCPQDLSDMALTLMAQLMIQGRMGGLPVLSARERRRAVIIEPAEA